ncbi:MAG: ATP-dependent metallopeptidase FtsH/Yme1/Tma family protein, partial [Bacteroidales bacterium]|nr:ATP-dependent metallopeptidase FtsH/Yme1/Tma family protein [Bacteroidales bacterium]
MEKKDLKKDSPQMPKPSKTRIIVTVCIMVVLLGLMFVDFGSGDNEINWNKFEKEMLATRDVERVVVVNKERADIYLKPESLEKFGKAARGGMFSGSAPNFYFNIGDVDTFEKKLSEAQDLYNFSAEERISPEYQSETNYVYTIFSWIFPLLLILGLWYLLFSKMGSGGSGGQIFNIGKSRAQVFDKERKVKVNFKDVAGLEEAKVEVMEIVDFLKNPEKYTKLG